MFKESLIPHIGAPEMRVEIDKKALFALASDTRLDILRALLPMRRTVTQLAEALNIDKAAVHRHLKKLEEGGFVKRFEDHGFVYYGLSWKARDILSPNENTRVIVLLSSSWIFLLVTIFLIIAAIQSGLGTSFGVGGAPLAGGSDAEDYEMKLSECTGIVPWWLFLLLAMGLAVIAAVMASIGIKALVRPKQKSSVRCTPVQRDSPDDD